MRENRDLEQEMIDKGILVYDSEDNFYHVGKGYSTDDVKKYVLKPKPMPKRSWKSKKSLNPIIEKKRLTERVDLDSNKKTEEEIYSSEMLWDIIKTDKYNLT
jgi:hypothetical protein